MDLQNLIKQAQDLISLPEIYYRAQELLDDPSSDAATLARVIETDTGLSVRLLRMANSPFYSPSGRIDRISYAVTLLGNSALRDLILSTVILRAFKNISTRLVDLTSFWHHSLYCGLAARQLSKLKGVLHGERMLVAGVVHDVGQLLLYQMQPELAKQALMQAAETDDGMYRAEQNVFGFTHCDVGAALLESWNLPAGLREMVAFHHEPARAGQHSLDAALLHLGNFVANRIEPGRQIAECLPVIDPMAWEITGLTEDVLEPVINTANDQFLESLDMLMPGKTAGRR